MADAVYGLRPGGLPGAAPAATPGAPRAPRAGASFGAALEAAAGTPIAFSKHAQRRIEQRGLQLDGDRMRRLQDAVTQAEQKGSRDSLILLDEMALVVSVQQHRVVTALDSANSKEHVFTNIDSVVIAK